MGCDIHFYVEKKQDGRWVSADEWEPSPDYVPGEGDREREIRYSRRFYSGRNYGLFAILAGVRNYWGINPIAEPRGVPDDVSDETLGEYATECDEQQATKWISKGYSKRLRNGQVSCPDWHSASWFTLEELLAFDWTQTVTCKTRVNGPQYEEWQSFLEYADEPGPKQEYSPISLAGLERGELKDVSREELDRLVKAAMSDRATCQDELEKLKDTYAEVEWQEPYHQFASKFWSNTIPRMLRLGGPKDVRCVFWFDN